MVVDINIDISEIDAFADKIGRLDPELQHEISEGLWIICKLIAADASADAGFKSGEMARSVYAIPIARGHLYSRFEVGATAPHAKFQEHGTRGPYPITPKNAKALRFEIGGRVIFAMRVTHPGIKATHFLSNAIRRRWPMVRELIRRALIIAKMNVDL